LRAADGAGEVVGMGGGGIHFGEEGLEGGTGFGVGDADIGMNLKQARKGHAGEGETAEGFGEDGGITDFEVAVVEDVHVVFEHGGFAEEVAQLEFVELGRGDEAEVFGVEAVLEGVSVAGLGAPAPFGADDLRLI